MKRLAWCLAVFIALSSNARVQAGFVVYTIKDIGNFSGYTTPNVGQSYSGTGYVGLYSTTTPGVNAIDFAHVFGLEKSSSSKTELEVDISGLFGTTIISATLSYVLPNIDSATSQIVTITSFDATGSLSYNFAPPSNLGIVKYTSVQPSSNSVDVTNLLQDRVQSDASWFGLFLTGSTKSQYADSGGFGADQAQVRLTVEYTDPPPTAVSTPEPASILMAGLAIGVLGSWLSMRQRANKGRCVMAKCT